MHVCLISHNDWSRNKLSGRRERGSVCTVDVYVYEGEDEVGSCIEPVMCPPSRDWRTSSHPIAVTTTTNTTTTTMDGPSTGSKHPS